MGALIAMIVGLGDDVGRQRHRCWWGDTWPDVGRARGQQRVMDRRPARNIPPGIEAYKAATPSPNISHDIPQLHRNPKKTAAIQT